MNADVYAKTGGCLEAGVLLALMAEDEPAALALVERLTPAEAHLLEPAAERLAELAYERRTS